MNMPKLWFACSFIVLVISTGFAQTNSTQAAAEVYRNEKLRFEFTLPNGWIVTGENEKAALLEMGKDNLKSGKKRTDAAIDYSAAREVQLLMASKKPVGALGNSMIGMSFVKQASASFTPKMVVEAGKSVFLANPTFKLVRDTAEKTIGGKKFAYIDLEVQSNGQTVQLHYLATMVGQNALAIAVSYLDDADFKTVQASLNTMRFF